MEEMFGPSLAFFFAHGDNSIQWRGKKTETVSKSIETLFRFESD